MESTVTIRLKRVYEEPSKDDGTRILVDRLWPRGLTKEKAHVNLWLKEIAPSNELRKWFAHDPAKWPEFQSPLQSRAETQRPRSSLFSNKPSARGPATLLYGAKDTEHNEAVVLHELLSR